jgi:hypothetical protein
MLKKTVGVIALPTIVPASVFGKGGVLPSEKINVASIGVGIMGTMNTKSFLAMGDCRVAAVCDCRKSQRDKAKGVVDKHYGNSDCKRYADFREVLADRDIDAVMIATPDNWHALISLYAAKAGKDMYTEKALGLSVAEDRALGEAVKKYGNVFQFGTMQRSSDNFRQACELVRNGKIGELKRIYVGTPVGQTMDNQPTEAVPEGFDYEMWLGPAPKVPYSYHRCRPHTREDGWSKWYHIADYCLGAVGGFWGIHHVNIAQWGNGTDYTGPVEVEGTGVIPRDGLGDTITRWDVDIKYGNGVVLNYMDCLTCYDRVKGLAGIGSNLELLKRGEGGMWGEGVIFEGTDGWVFVHRGGHIDANPKSLLSASTRPGDIRLKRSASHHRDFLDCVKTRGKTICDIESSIRTDTICHLTNIAVRLGRKVEWNPETERFINDAAADKFLRRPMRQSWSI